MCFPLVLGVLYLCFVVHCFVSFFSFAIILERKGELVALLLLSYSCFVTVNVLWLFLTVLRVGLRCVIVHTHLLYLAVSVL